MELQEILERVSDHTRVRNENPFSKFPPTKGALTVYVDVVDLVRNLIEEGEVTIEELEITHLTDFENVVEDYFEDELKELEELRKIKEIE